MKKQSLTDLFIVMFRTLFFGLFLFSFTAHINGKPIDPDDASRAVQGWLGRDPAPMNTVMTARITSVCASNDPHDRTLYYAVSLSPEGFVIVPADDELEPILAFSPQGTYVQNPANPLTVLLEKDLTGRKESLALTRKPESLRKRQEKNWGKWQSLLASSGDDFTVGTLGIGSLSDVRAAPLLQSQWDQEDEYGQLCYNYYTPGYYPAGCVATAMAQLIRFYQHPSAGIGYAPYTIYVYGSPQETWTLGGDGVGGPYSWSQMLLVPDASITLQQRQAIGALCHDAGASVGMDYESSGSSASLADAKDAIVDVFGYADTVYGIGQSWGAIPMSTLYKMVNPDLDAGMPAILGIKRSGSGHAVIADGYGYNSDTLYHHLNMGWGGADNVWYALPLIDAYYSYDTINECIYNIYVNGGGEIISGRILSSIGLPVEGAAVKAYYGQTLAAQTATNAKGIYALTELASNRTYSIQPEKTGYNITAQNVTVGASQDNYSYQPPVCGNVWGVDFTADSAGPPVAYDQVLSITDENELAITLTATDDGLPDPPGALEYVVTSLSQHGWLFDPTASQILTIPYVLQDPAQQVRYVPCAYYDGADSFSFIAHDGASASEPAEISIDVDRSNNVTFEIDTDTYSAVILLSDYHDARSQVIYLASELNGPQIINQLALNVYQIPGGTLNNWTIRMKRTTRSSFVYANFDTSGWTTVYQSNQVFQYDWNTFDLQTAFEYNGADNLMIDFSFNNSSVVGGGYPMVSVMPQNRVLYHYSNDPAGDPLDWQTGTWITKTVPNIKLNGFMPLPDPIQGDVSRDCRVNLRDLMPMAKAWLTSQEDPAYNEACDISPANDNQITLDDLAVIAENWMIAYGQ